MPERSETRRSLAALNRLAGEDAGLDDPTAAEMWIDDDNVMRRMRGSTKIPAQEGVPGGNLTMDFRLRDFGAKLDTTAPRGSETYDATGALRELISRGKR